MVLSVVFHDVNKDDHLNIERHRVDGALFDSISYAGGTICASQNTKSLTRMLHEIEIESDRYGLKLNQKNANWSNKTRKLPSTSSMECKSSP